MININKLVNLILDQLDGEQHSETLALLKDRILEPLKMNIYPHIYPMIFVSYVVVTMLLIILILVIILLFITCKKFV
jgi:hypothetical protein